MYKITVDYGDEEYCYICNVHGWSSNDILWIKKGGSGDRIYISLFTARSIIIETLSNEESEKCILSQKVKNMKIRIGFVSNSSSSSFCIYKKLMTSEQISEFRDFIHRSHRDCETSIGEDGDYFIGSLDMHDDLVNDFIHRNFKRNEYANYC